MGSLMAGWSSPRKDSRAGKFQKNKSLTKEEIESYWKTKKRAEEDHFNLGNIKRSVSFPPGDGRVNFDDEIKRSDCWWMRSNWAFLNEPPLTAMEGPSYKYAAQYHIANIGSSKTVNNPEMMNIY